MFDVDAEPNDGALPFPNFDFKPFSFLFFVFWKSASFSGELKLLMDLLKLGLEMLSFSFSPMRGV